MTTRQTTRAQLEKAGFQLGALPEERAPESLALRPAGELALRLMALEAVFSWAGAPEEAMSSARLRAYAERGALAAAMTDEELEIWEAPRGEAQAEHGESIGWMLEQLWAVAWTLGFSRRPALGPELIPDRIIEEIFYSFLPGLDAAPAAMVAKARPRALAEVAAAEDLFACAAASARGEHAELLRARWLALRWCVSPELDWDEPE